METEGCHPMSKRKVIVYEGRALDPTRSEDRLRLSEISTAAIRLRNQGASPARIAQVLGVEEEPLTLLMETAINNLAAEDAISVRGRQQAMIHDMFAALYPALNSKSVDYELKAKIVSTMKGVLEYEGKLKGATAPERIRIGVDQETFTTRAEEDLRALGIDPDMDVPLEEDDGTWANT